MLLFQSLECYGEFTTIISEDLNQVLEKISEGFDSAFQINIWKNGEMIFSTKEYENFNYDDIYVELMSFIAERG